MDRSTSSVLQVDRSTSSVLQLDRSTSSVLQLDRSTSSVLQLDRSTSSVLQVDHIGRNSNHDEFQNLRNSGRLWRPKQAILRVQKLARASAQFLAATPARRCSRGIAEGVKDLPRRVEKSVDPLADRHEERVRISSVASKWGYGRGAVKPSKIGGYSQKPENLGKSRKIREVGMMGWDGILFTVSRIRMNGNTSTHIHIRLKKYPHHPHLI